MKRILLGAAMAAAVLSGVPAFGQTYQDSGGTIVRGMVPIQPGVGPLFTASNPGRISGSFSASLSGFQPTPAYSQLSVGATSSRVALPSGSVIVVYNTGANAAFVTLGSSTVTATAGNDAIPAGGWMAFTIGPNTFLAAIETAGATSLNISGGTGLPTGAGAGGGSGGGGGSNASVGATGSTAPGSATYNGMLVNGGNMVGASGSAWGSVPTGLNVLGVNADVLSSALPTGAATAANQEVTAAGASATSAQAVQGVSGGVPLTITGAVTCSGCGGGGGGSGGSTPQTTNSVAISLSTATTTQLIAGSGSNLTYITQFNIVAGATGGITLEYGTQTTNPCDTGTTALTGAYPWTAQAGIAMGSGLGAIFKAVPAGNAVCAVTTGTVSMQGSIGYTQNAATITSFGGGGGSAPYVQTNAYTPISVTKSSSTTTISSGSPTTVVAVNVGTTNGAYCAPGATATTSDHYLAPGGGWFSWNPNGATTLACITSSSGLTTTVNVTGGSGTPTGSGGGGGGGGGGAPTDTLLPATGSLGPITAVNNFSTGLQVQNWQNGRVTLTGTATSGSIISFTGLTGWNSGLLECQSGGTQGTNQYEVDVTGPTGGTLVRRVATFTGPTASIPVNLAAATFLNVVADQWTSGGLTCQMRVSVNQGVPDDYALPVQADLSASFSGNTIATTQVIAAVPGQAIYIAGYDAAVTAAATGNGSWQFVYGTGTNCSGGPTNLGSPQTFAAGAGIARSGSVGAQLTVPPGNALCVQLTAAQPVTANFTYAQR